MIYTSTVFLSFEVLSIFWSCRVLKVHERTFVLALYSRVFWLFNKEPQEREEGNLEGDEVERNQQPKGQRGPQSLSHPPPSHLKTYRTFGCSKLCCACDSLK